MVGLFHFDASGSQRFPCTLATPADFFGSLNGNARLAFWIVVGHAVAIPTDFWQLCRQMGSSLSPG